MLLLWLLCVPISDVLSIHDSVLAAQCTHTMIKAVWVREKRGSDWRFCSPSIIPKPILALSLGTVFEHWDYLCSDIPLCLYHVEASLSGNWWCSYQVWEFLQESQPSWAAPLWCCRTEVFEWATEGKWKETKDNANFKMSFFSVGHRLEVHLMKHNFFSSSL